MSDGYCLSLAYVCLLDVVRSLSLLIDHPGQTSAQGSRSSSSSDYGGSTTVEHISGDCTQSLLESSWCGVLSAMSLLLDASTDDSSTENILKHLETFARSLGHCLNFVLFPSS